MSRRRDVRADGSGRIVVLGGYGAVGRALVGRLVGAGRPVVVAGRDARQAAATAAAHPGARPAAVDLTAPASLRDTLSAGDVVVNCTGLEDLRLVQVAVAAGAHYTDITATRTYLDALATVHDTAVAGRRTILCSVGLAPGLTNLLAADIDRRHPDPRPIDITLLLGLGDAYGAASHEWTLSRLGATFPDPVDGHLVRNFSDGRRVALPGGFGARRAVRFDLADQHTLTRTLDRPVTTRLAFDPAAVTTLAAAAGRLPPLGRAVAGLLRRLPPVRMGTAWYAGRVERRGGPGHWTLGASQTQATAAVTAVAVELLRDDDPPPGVHHLHQLVTLTDVAARLHHAEVLTTQPLSAHGDG